ncbi:MAG: hypothetical protein Q4A67_04165 [Aerococcus sp.]|nr:hypothetical protein [Aerococcus sp.]
MKEFMNGKLTMVTEDADTKKKGRLTLNNVSEAMSEEQAVAVIDALTPLLEHPVIEKTETRTYSL